MKLTRRGLLAATILAPIVPWPKMVPERSQFDWIMEFAMRGPPIDWNVPYKIMLADISYPEGNGRVFIERGVSE